jgi:predicted PurR-regulated permease PerM
VPARTGAFGGLAAIALVVVAALAFREIASPVVPVIFGLFLAFVAWPRVGSLERRGTPHSRALGDAIAEAGTGG